MNRLSVQSVVRHNETLQELLSQRESDLLLAASIADRLMEKNSRLMATLQETEAQLSSSEQGRLSAEASLGDANEDIHILELERQDWLEQRSLLQSNLNAALLQRVTDTKNFDPSEATVLQGEIQKLTDQLSELKSENERLAAVAVTAEAELAFAKAECLQQKQSTASLQLIVERSKTTEEQSRKHVSEIEHKATEYKQLYETLQTRMMGAAKETDNLQVQLKESEGTAGEYMQRCDALSGCCS